MACLQLYATLACITRLAIARLFRARWTERIHEEWISKLLKNRPDLGKEKLERTRRLMNSNVRDCLVTGFEPLIDSLELPDQNDRHVLAAAIRCKASMILTRNLKDFPAESLEPHGLQAQDPDDFIAALIDHSSDAVCNAARLQRTMLKNPPIIVDEFLNILEQQELIKTVSILKKHADKL